MASSTTSETSHGLLDRESIVATPRFNRWLVPPAALAIHLCIGMAYGFSVFWLPMTKLLTGTGRGLHRPGLPQSAHFVQLQLDGAHGHPHLRAVHRHAGHLRGHRRCLGGARGAPQVRLHRRPLLGRRAAHRRLRRIHPPVVAGLSRLRLHRRHRPGSGLHHAGLDANQMVPRPARHGHRLRHHGLRRRCHDRLAPGGLVHGALRRRRCAGRGHHADGAGRHLLRGHVPGRLRLPGAAFRLASGLAGLRLRPAPRP